MVAKKQNNRYGNRSRNNQGNGNRNNNNQNSHRSRNTYKQNLERYTTLAKDAAANGDYVTAEGYKQHAEHYFRQLNDLGPVAEQKPKAPAPEIKKETTAPPPQSTPKPEAEKKKKKEEPSAQAETVEIDLGDTTAS